MRKKAFASADYWKIYGPAFLITVLAFILAYRFVGQPPPKRIRMASGMHGGAYNAFALKYAAVLARHGITVDVVETSGSGENLDLLARGGDTGADIALVQSGMATTPPQEGLLSLASLYFEPLWVFYRTPTGTAANAGGVSAGTDVPPAAPAHLVDFRGQRIAVGLPNSGTRLLSLALLKESNIDASNTTLQELGTADAVKALTSGDIDVACIVSSADGSAVRGLLAQDGIALYSFTQAEAYTRRFHYLSSATLPEGMIDLEHNRPSHDYQLIGPSATLVARQDFHPALVDLMLQAAAEIHGSGDAFAEPGKYPNPRHLDFTFSKDADRYFKMGPPLLQRYLPFWLATLIDRLKVMLLPLLMLLIPLFKVLPPTFRWKTRRKILRWYTQLQMLDLELEHDPRLKSDDELRREIDRIESEVCHVTVPLGYADQLYNLRLHIALMRDKLNRHLARTP